MSAKTEMPKTWKLKALETLLEAANQEAIESGVINGGGWNIDELYAKEESLKKQRKTLKALIIAFSNWEEAEIELQEENAK